MICSKDRYVISAEEPVQKLGQLVVGDIIGESQSLRHPVWKTVLRVGRLPFAMEENIAIIPNHKAKI